MRNLLNRPHLPRTTPSPASENSIVEADGPNRTIANPHCLTHALAATGLAPEQFSPTRSLHDASDSIVERARIRGGNKETCAARAVAGAQTRRTHRLLTSGSCNDQPPACL